ncbi:Oligopeptide transporter 4 [Choanephora cucurbitarum]|uniref:Oligopeptide transporter 4 n=1 Tax=Choanephora cucurbitarum TaxID=101091 RepID=A0A1C7NP96_9FUNG|nr:Oligopeptide transporter 4 [Choanephora cucurbitarum]
MAEDHNRADREEVLSEKVPTTNQQEKTEEVLNEKGHTDLDEPWIAEKYDTEKPPVYISGEDDLDIAIINDVSVTEDDPTMKVMTFRAVLTGVLLSALSSSVAQLMVFKPVGIALTDTFMLILAYVFCNAWAHYLPRGGWLNPGPFNMKEHACIFVMVSSANTSAYGTYILSAQELFYPNQVPSAAGGIFLLFATQMVGYGIAGQLRPYLVYPKTMTWPTSLPVVSLLKTLNTDRGEAKRRTRYFFLVFLAIFIYEFIPQYMFPMLGGISIICLAKNDSRWVQRLFGGLATNEGMGMFQLCFDWNLLSSYTPLVIPLWSQLNVFFGIFLLWIIAPLLYYYDVWHAQSFPYLSNSIYRLYDNGTSAIYPQDDVLNADSSLNQTALEEVGNPYFAAVYAFSYVAINLGVTSTMTHVALFYGKDILNYFRKTKKAVQEHEEDIHMRLMKAYKEVPTWWYYAVYVIGIGINIGICYANKSQLPWWGVIVAIAISTILSLPLNMISAITGYGFGLNVLTEMICGFVLPGYPVANMYFKTLGYNTMSQAGIMTKDLKIGHYLKVPPRLTFLNQMLGTSIGCIFNYIVNFTITQSKRDVLLDPVGNQFWNGATPQTINSAAITWGALGPMAMFGPGTAYYIVLWAFVIGFFLPVPFWLLHKKFPTVGFNFVNVPMIMIGLCFMPGSNTSWVTVSFLLILFTQGYVKRRHSDWFAKNNYLLSAALDSGTSLMVFFISMALYGGVSGNTYEFPVWWGNRADIDYIDQCCMNCSD